MVNRQIVTLPVGHIDRLHGLAGELQCTVSPAFAALFDDEATEPQFVFVELDAIAVPFFLEDWRFRSDDTMFLTLEGVHTEQQARRLTGKTLLVEQNLLPEAQSDALSWQDLVGYHVVDDRTGRDLGEILAVDDSTLNTLFCLPADRLLPAADDLIRAVDAQSRVIRMLVPDGL